VTRRDRAAMTLALEVLRARGRLDPESALATVLEVLFQGGVDSRRLRDWLFDAWLARHRRGRVRRRGGWRRFLAARLALFLRAVLRADAGDYGPCVHFAGFGRDGHPLERGHDPDPDGMRGWCWGRRGYTPLWELAAK
jgi:hypothetical protein